MSKTRMFQLFVARETQANVLATGLVAAANAKIQVKDLKCTFDPEKYEREVNRGSLSPLTTINGVVPAQMTFSVEMSGSSNEASTVAGGKLPVWAPLLEACCMEMQTIRRIGLGATFGGSAKVFEHGEIVTGGTSTATAKVVHDTWEGQATLRIIPITGTITANETITGGTNGATSVNGGLSNTEEGVVWQPYSEPEITMDNASITGTVSANDVLKGDTSGAVVQALQAVTGAGTALSYRPLDGTLTSGETLTNITQTGTIVNVTNFVQSKVPTLSLAGCEDGSIKTMKGCRGTFTMSGEIGKPVMMNFTFKGQLASIADGGVITGVAYESLVPPKFMGHEFKVGGYATGDPGYLSYMTEHTPRVTKFSFDYGNDVALIKDATQATGIVGADVTKRKTKGSMDPEKRPLASYPFLTKMRDGVPFRKRVTIGSANSNRFDITAPGCVIGSEGVGDRDGRATSEFNYDCSVYRWNGAEGDHRELVITYSNLAHAW